MPPLSHPPHCGVGALTSTPASSSPTGTFRMPPLEELAASVGRSRRPSSLSPTTSAHKSGRRQSIARQTLLPHCNAPRRAPPRGRHSRPGLALPAAPSFCYPKTIVASSLSPKLAVGSFLSSVSFVLARWPAPMPPTSTCSPGSGHHLPPRPRRADPPPWQTLHLQKERGGSVEASWGLCVRCKM